MPDILHRVGIAAHPERVYAALTTIDGLRHWWIVQTSGEAWAGGLINFGTFDMEVLEVVPNELVRWRCTRGPEEWLGTEVSFRLAWRRDQTLVLFRHANWKEPDDPLEFMYHCSTKWAVFLLSLRDYLDRNEGRPAPYDIKIHVGE